MNNYYIKYLENLFNINLTEKECGIINFSSKIIEYKKGFIPIIQGDVLTNAYVIVKGLVRGFYIDENGNEVTKCFSCEKGFFSCEGLISSKTASFSIECLEDVLCISIPYETIKILKESNSKISGAFHNIILKEFAILEKRSKDILLENATVRYQQFITDYYELSKRLKQKYIASYLGISPVTLSRLKKSKK